jgi:NitT/TauT family transport system substrate-binding protein
MKKYILVFLLVCASFFSVFAGSKQEKAKTNDDDYVIKIGYGIGPGLCSVPFFVAQQLGYFEDEGLRYESVMIDIGQIPLLLTNGTMDVTNNLLAGMIQPIVNGLDIKIPLALHTGCLTVIVRADSPIKSVKDLKGRKIGTPGLASPPNIILQRYLENEGIKSVGAASEVEWVVLPGPELNMALERGLVDAIATGDIPGHIAEDAGTGRIIVDTSVDDFTKDEFCCVVAASSDAALNHPEALAKVCRAIQRAALYTEEHPEEVAKLSLEQHYVAGEEALNARLLRTYNYDASVSAVHVAIERNARDLQALGLIDASVDIKKLTEDTFIALPGVPDSIRRK